MTCAGGHGGPPLRGGLVVQTQLLDPSRHKKTMHALHRRLVVTSTASTADVIRLPNWAGFCIRGGFIEHDLNRKHSLIHIQIQRLKTLSVTEKHIADINRVSHSSHIHSYPSRREGVAALPYAELWIHHTSENVPIVVENLPAAALAAQQARSDNQAHTHRQNPKLTRNHIQLCKPRDH